MDVVVWRYAPRPVAARNGVPHPYWPSTTIGIIGTLLVHALIIPSAYLASRGAKSSAPEIQESASVVNSNVDSMEGLVLITLPTDANPGYTMPRDMSLPLSPIKMAAIPRERVDPPALLDVEILPLSDEQPVKLTGDGEDGAERARFQGIYSGQIRARIERIWRRPKTPVGEGTSGAIPVAADESFQCQVQIVQDSNGNVQETLLLNCNGSAVWQRSLIVAIQQASPLPAPPSTTVFTTTLSLNIVGYPYVAGGSDAGYETSKVKSAEVVVSTKSPDEIAHQFLPFRATVRSAAP
jgi:TonB C terminal